MTHKAQGRIKITELSTDTARYTTTYRFRHRGESYLVTALFHPERDRYSVRVVREQTREPLFDTRDFPELEEDMTQDRDAIDVAKQATRAAWERAHPVQ